MSKGQATYHKTWSLEDILRYVEGDMSPEESRRIESDIKQDPFLRDTVDGYAGHARIYIDHHLQQLQSRFDTHASGSKMSPILGMAATILLLLVCGWYIFFFRGDRIQAENEHSMNQLLEQRQAADLLESRSDRSIQREQEESQLKIDDSMSVFDQRRPANLTDGSMSRSAPLKARNRVGNGLITGIVIDADGQPLIGASVRFPNNDAEITTDFDGRFAVELKLRDSLAIVDYSGFKSGAFPISGGREQTFQLIEGIAIDESIVTTPEVSLLSAGKKDPIPQAPTLAMDVESDADNAASSLPTTEATPERGLRKYDRYIKRNLKYPAAAETAEIEGDVIVQFKILPGGELFDIRIIQSLGYGCDEEAIRLIKEGPAWETLDPELIGQATYTITFKL